MSENFTDTGNARRLARLHSEDLRYVEEFGHWLVWDGSVWRRDTTGELYRRAKSIPIDLLHEAAADPDASRREAIARHAAKTESERSIRAMIHLAKSEPPIPARPDDFDADPLMLNTPKGMIDLQTGEIHSHDRAAMCTRSTGAGYVPGARSELWEKCLETWLPNSEVRSFVQRIVGYSVIGTVTEHILPILYGLGANGKSVFIEAIRRALGEYAAQTPAETLVGSRTTGVPNDVARLKGARFVTASETEENGRLSEGKVKSMTGGDRLIARFMRGEWFEFSPTFTVWLSTNHRPVVQGTDEGIWRRLKLIPFNVRIPEDQRDPELAAKLDRELEGVLAWAVEGALEYQRIGLCPPAAVEAATNEYRRDQDVIGAFIAEECIEDPNGTVSIAELFERFEGWCGRSGEKSGSKRAFGQKLEERGLSKGRSANARIWRGLSLRSGFEDQPAGLLSE